MKIIIIDDNADITDAISLFAESQNYSCHVCNDGKEGSNIAKKENFDLILLDLTMPDFSGYDVLSILKNESNFDMKKIVVLTASNLDTSVSEKIESLGISQLARKPLSLDSLEDIFSKFT
jgi:DNA-binding response OmpR family regulator